MSDEIFDPHKAEAVPVEDAGGDPFPDFGAILANSSTEKRATETRTFTLKGKPYKFEIYVDGRDDAELWISLLAGMNYGFSLQNTAKYTGQDWSGIDVTYPAGPGGSKGIKQFTVRNTTYIGMVRVLFLCLKRPSWQWEECLIMGHEMGSGFSEVCDWASKANGVTEDFLKTLTALRKNATSR